MSTTPSSHSDASTTGRDGVDETPPGGQPTRHPSPWRTAVSRLAVVVGVCAVWGLTTEYIAQPFRIPSESMESTLDVGDRIVVNKLGAHDVHRGDVVVFKDTQGWIPTTEPSTVQKIVQSIHLAASGNHLVKRVIGVGGDHVSCATAGAPLKVNGVNVTEPYVRMPSFMDANGKPQSCTEPFTITVPAGHVWVMGDNRSNSADSRAHDYGSGGKRGSIPVSAIVGKEVATVWPLTHVAGSASDTAPFSHVPTPR